ncbi:hypothetical protein H7347_08250 [Corynebacterium sp. zg-331]|uniref:hypothetical protein n=1 Tax=unclassified Corynebacterium TaxID=2624378 RepID=UPI00128C9EEB|nr:MULTISPECIES: hypothetical protein [unclassified Corynebacterium]MBC3186558.1 hypothetical protein [Corynebacterium sp. zg-331]MPV53042.1 hypothetical protein [Corynebacterium sp. zg331]
MPSATRRAKSPRRALPRGAQGSVTVEAAVAIGALIVVFAALVAGLITLAAQVSAIDTAGAAARQYAISGERLSPERGSVDIAEQSGRITAVASVPAPLGTMRARAVFPAEAAEEAGPGEGQRGGRP